MMACCCTIEEEEEEGEEAELSKNRRLCSTANSRTFHYLPLQNKHDAIMSCHDIQAQQYI